MKVTVHYHAAGTPRLWACGWETGQASGEIEQVNCEKCLDAIRPKEASSHADDSHAGRADHENLSVPPAELHGDERGSLLVRAEDETGSEMPAVRP